MIGCKNKIYFQYPLVGFDIQRFADNNDTSALGTLKLVGDLISTLNLKKFVNDLSDVFNGIKENANPILEFFGEIIVGEFIYKETDENDFTYDQKSRKTYLSSYATLIVKTVSIIDCALAVINEFDEKKASVATISEKVASISADIVDIGSAIAEINSLKIKPKNSNREWVLPVVASGVSLVANVLSSMDSMTDQNKSDIAKSYFEFLKTAGNEIIKDAFSNAVASEVSKLANEDIMGDVLKNVKFAKVFEETSKSLIKTIGIVFTLANSAFKGISAYNNTFKKYTEDGIPENLAIRDALIDAVTVAIHDAANTYTKGADDLVFKGLQNLASWITGRNPGNKGNYAEVIADLFKAFNFKNTGTEEDDFLFSGLNNEMVYGYDGNDYISNVASSATIFGGHGNDIIFSRKDSEGYYSDLYGNSIIAGPGDDILVSNGTIESLYGGKGSDLIAIYGNQNTAYGEDDKDKIAVYGNNNWIYGGTDSDILILDGKASGNKIDGGAGNDTIAAFENANGNKINGGSGNDLIIISNTKKQVIQYTSGDGNDEIIGYDESDTISISGGSYKTSVSGQDVVITVGKSSIKLHAAKGKKIHINRDVVDTGNGTSTPKSEEPIVYPGFWNNSNVIRGTNGNDAINNTLSSVMIEAMAGEDSISNSGKNVTIDSGIGNDTIENWGNDEELARKANVKIDSGVGNDFIKNHVESVSIYAGDGNDFIYNTASNVTIDTGNGYRDFIENYGTNVMINSAEGNGYVYNGGDSVKIDSGLGIDTIYNLYGNNVIINSGAGDDSIGNGGRYVTIDAGSGNDFILNEGYAGNSVNVSAGAGDDSITNEGRYVTIDAGTGNDYIYNSSGDYVTIRGGNGDDLISLDNNFLDYSSYIRINYANGDGNDTIYGLNSDDTLQITGASYNTIKSGNDVIVKIGNGSIKLVDANNGRSLNIQGTLEIDSTLPSGWKYGNTAKTKLTASVASATNVDLTQTYGTNVATVDGSKITTARTFTANAKANSIKGGINADTIYGNAGADTIYGGSGNDKIYGGNDNDKLYGEAGNDSLYGNSGNDTLTGGAGNDTFFYESGNDVITDYIAGTDKIKLVSSTITSSSLSGSDVVLKTSNGNITVQKAKDKNITVIDKNGKETTQIYPIVEVNPLPNGWKSDTTGKTVTATVTSAANIDLTKTYGTKVEKVDGSKITKTVNIIGNAKANSIKGGKGADTISGGAGNDTVSLGGGADVYIYSSGNDLIQDYTAGADKIKLSGATITGSSISGSDVVLKVGSGSITVKKGKGKKITVIDAKGQETTQIYPIVEVNPLPNGWKSDTTGKTVTATVTSAANIDLTKTYGTKVEKVDGSKITKAVSIVGNAKANSLKGGKGADTISGGAGNDTVSLGGGADVYIYSSGNDLIQDYTAGADKIKLSGATITGSSISGSDVVLKVGSGSITVKKGKGKKITVIDAKGQETTQIYPIVEVNPLPSGWKPDTTGKTVTATVTSAANIDLTKTYGTKVEKVDGSKITKAVSIVGNAKPNSIKGGKGADTISGGAGNDTVSLGGGADVYIYSSGNDVIQDYTAGADKISLASGSITSASVSSSNVILNVSNGGKISVKGGKGKNITVIDSKGNETTNIYPAETLPAGISIKSSVLTASSSFKGNKIDLADYSATTKVNASAVSQAVSIIGSAANNSLKGGKGADTISGGAGNDTVSLGGGKDVYIYSGGNDVIQDYTFEDKIKVSTGSISGSSISGNDVVLKVGSGSITVKNGKGKYITSIDSKGNATVNIYDQSNGKEIDNRYGSGVTLISGGSGNDTIWNAEFFVSINGGAGDDWIDSDADNVTINGGDGNDWIADYGGYNVTISGGKGNDTIRLGSYYESARTVIKYASSDGEDVISNVNDNDTLQITGSTYTTMKSGSNVVIKVGSGSITVENGLNSGFNIDFISSSGSNSRTLDLLYDNNFITDELQIDDISEVSPISYSVGQIEYSADNNNGLLNSSQVFHSSKLLPNEQTTSDIENRQ